MKQNTTSHTDAYLKRQAKKIKKEQNITHIQALDIAAVQAGYTNFKNFQNSLQKSSASKSYSSTAELVQQKKLQFVHEKALNPYRNLLVAGVNDLLKKKLISLDSPDIQKRGDDQGYIFTEILGFHSVVKWRDISFGELEISVWWKYDHSRHPQAELSGTKRENFNTTSPLARKELYKNFVGVTVTGWLEREKGKHLMGKNGERFVDVYTRKGEKTALEKMPEQIPSGFEAEGKFYF
ncbi:hypothetical protein [Flavobacterium piscisymbiosum]|uniref:Uncharacterized protein n=1 Tax=Flavobacterium piscisymbiosum TaxID=2893753 RepID=A0ABS8MFC5_9FLAO|nr:hypothetical protein [Flavobacterium sp. F-30]MCC9063592.1 hypothetical protein [Flavobacterium sp. F-30]